MRKHLKYSPKKALSEEELKNKKTYRQKGEVKSYGAKT